MATSKMPKEKPLIDNGVLNTSKVGSWSNVYGNNIVGASANSTSRYFVIAKLCTDFPDSVTEGIYAVVDMKLNNDIDAFQSAVIAPLTNVDYGGLQTRNLHCGGAGRIHHFVYMGILDLSVGDSVTMYVTYNNSNVQLRLLSPELYLIEL